MTSNFSFQNTLMKDPLPSYRNNLSFSYLYNRLFFVSPRSLNDFKKMFIPFYINQRRKYELE